MESSCRRVSAEGLAKADYRENSGDVASVVFVFMLNA
jgi:hypothetical protein